MNLGTDFLLGVLGILALFYGPPLVLSIAAWIVARRRPGSIAAIVCWVAAAVGIVGLLMIATREGMWVAAMPTVLMLAIATPRVFPHAFTTGGTSD